MVLIAFVAAAVIVADMSEIAPCRRLCAVQINFGDHSSAGAAMRTIQLIDVDFCTPARHFSRVPGKSVGQVDETIINGPSSKDLLFCTEFHPGALRK